jgi:hypothetical protein
MCTGSSSGTKTFLSSPLSIFSKPVSPYASNYGYGAASGPSAITEDEREWYIGNGYGDPLATTGATAATSGRYVTSGRNTSYIEPTAANPGYYQGVGTEARNAYLRALADADVVRQQTALYSSAPKAAGSTMTYAGSALGIPA